MTIPPTTAIYQVLHSIPAGRVATYGQVAQLAGLGRAARFVGSTLKNLPDESTLPWHRVVNARGEISLPKHSRAYAEQVSRLEKEDVLLQSGRVDLNRYGWR